MKFMKHHGFEVIMISSNGPEIEVLQDQEQCPLMIVPFTRKISPWKDLQCLLKLIHIFRQLKPDIVHTHTPKAGLLGMWAAWFARVPVRLHTIAGLPWMETTGLMRKLLKFIEKLTAMPASRIYPNSNMLKNFLEQHRIAIGKMKVLGKGSSNGIDSIFFSVNDAVLKEAMRLREEKKVDHDAWVWIFVGRLVKDKGIGELLDAFNDLHIQFPQDRLWLLGIEEPGLDPIDEIHKQLLYSHPAIECMGFQKDIRPYLAAAQVLTFPSYREGFPNVPMQAGLMGCMLILSDINGCNELVENKVDGLLVPPKNSRALLEAMLYTRQHPHERKKFANKIQNKIRMNYNQQEIWNLILQEYTIRLSEKNIC